MRLAGNCSVLLLNLTHLYVFNKSVTVLFRSSFLRVSAFIVCSLQLGIPFGLVLWLFNVWQRYSTWYLYLYKNTVEIF